MKNLISFSTVFLLLAVASTLGYSPSQYSTSYSDQSCHDNIPAILKKNAGLSTLLDLVTKAGLVDKLSGPGLFTVFAPTDEAFASIDSQTLKYILDNVELLRDILTYHVLPFEIAPSVIASIHHNVYELSTLEGAAPIRINVYREKESMSAFDPVKTVTINGALVLKALKACNGYVYVIDKVLNPKDLMPENDEIEVFLRNDLTIMKRIFDILNDFLPTNIFFRPETIFAPTDAAFAALPPGFLDSLLADKQKLLEVIENHVITGVYFYSRGLETGPVLSMNGATVAVKVSPEGITYGGANVIIADLTNVQGVIHVIDAIILTDSQMPSINKKY